MAQSLASTGIEPLLLPNLRAVEDLQAGHTYKIVATDSNNVAISEGVDYIWDASESNDYLSSKNDEDGDGDAAQWKAEAGLGKITVTVTPDGKNYTGDAVSYEFKTEVGSKENVIGTGVLENAGFLTGANWNATLTALLKKYGWTENTNITDGNTTATFYDISTGLTTGETYTVSYVVKRDKGATLLAYDDSFEATKSTYCCYYTEKMNIGNGAPKTEVYSTGLADGDVIAVTLKNSAGEILGTKEFTYSK